MAAVCLSIGSAACLASPPSAPDEEAAPDGGAEFSACGNARIDVAYMSRFAVDPDNYGRVGLDRVALVINSGAGLLDVGALEVIEATVDDEYSTLSFEAYDRQGPPIEPGEARGELRSTGRDMVLAVLREEWTDPNAPELSGLLVTARSRGVLKGIVQVALGPHRVTLDLEFDLTSFQGSGAYPQAASRATSVCADQG